MMNNEFFPAELYQGTIENGLIVDLIASFVCMDKDNYLYKFRRTINDSVASKSGAGYWSFIYRTPKPINDGFELLGIWERYKSQCITNVNTEAP